MHTDDEKDVYEDRWLAFESFIEASETYDKLQELEEVHSVSVCGVIQSSDIEPMNKSEWPELPE